ncbi:MAG TPA: type II secretion system protein GspJ [Planctomycetota bacterium]|nr:type II secretion system protein GspJ [Planctomycetota bacterium]
MRRTSTSGFTLIEILLAVALCALVMTLVYGVLMATIQASERVDELTHGSEIGPAILAQIREDIGAAFLPGTDQDYFVGQERSGRDRVDFVSSAAVYASETPGAEPTIHSVNEIGYQVKEGPSGEDGLVLYRRVDPFVDAQPLQGGRLTAIAEKVTSFKVTYSAGAEWLTSWVSSKHENTLPSSIKIELKLRVPDRTAEGGFQERTFATIIPLAK